MSRSMDDPGSSRAVLMMSSAGYNDLALRTVIMGMHIM